MRATALSLPDVIVIEPDKHGDERGFLIESYNKRDFDSAIGRQTVFIQDNHSKSGRGVLRGLHFQRAPHAQGKLIRVVSGAIWDVAVDLRPGSATFGRWTGTELSADNGRQLWMPEGFAHGFLVLSETADVLYKTTDYYAPDSEGALRWDDPALGIEWPLDGAPILSERDRRAPVLAEVELA